MAEYAMGKHIPNIDLFPRVEDLLSGVENKSQPSEKIAPSREIGGSLSLTQSISSRVSELRT